MRPNNELKLHFINVNHGDATIIEFPDYQSQNTAHFGVVDFGAKRKDDRGFTRDYMKALFDLREDNDTNFKCIFEFICVTHPHNDHYGGLRRFMDEFTAPNILNKCEILNFWDCGFRTTSSDYNAELDRIAQNQSITFVRVSSGMECEFGETRISVLAPSVDLRNRFDTYGINKNNASIVLKIKFRNSYIILAGDAEYASWGKSTEEFPRMERITFYSDALGLAGRGETSDQLKCDLLRISHHGSKHGTSLEYLERLKPNRVVIPAGDQQWYHQYHPNWEGDFPHPLVVETIEVLDPSLSIGQNTYITGDVGNIIFKYSGNWSPREMRSFRTEPGDPNFTSDLLTNWS